jgi:hypothetical protein
MPTKQAMERARELAAKIDAVPGGVSTEELAEHFAAALDAVRLEEANWWVPLVPNGVSKEIEKQRDEHIADLERSL